VRCWRSRGSLLHSSLTYFVTLPPRSRFLQGPETDKRAVREIRRAIDTGTECTVRLLNYTKSGQPFWCELETACAASGTQRPPLARRNMFHLAPVLGFDGKIQYFVGVQVDVTARDDLAEDKLAVSSKLAAQNVVAGLCSSVQARCCLHALTSFDCLGALTLPRYAAAARRFRATRGRRCAVPSACKSRTAATTRSGRPSTQRRRAGRAGCRWTTSIKCAASGAAMWAACSSCGSRGPTPSSP